MRPFAALGALFASLFGMGAKAGAPLPPASQSRGDGVPMPERPKTSGEMIFPPMQFHRARRNPTPNDGRGHYLEEPHPSVLAPLARMKRLAKAADDVSKGREQLSGKRLRRRVRELQCAISNVAHRMAAQETRELRRAA